MTDDSKSSAKNFFTGQSPTIIAFSFGSVIVAIAAIASIGSSPVQSTSGILTTGTDILEVPEQAMSTEEFVAPLSAPRTGIPMLVAYPLAMLPDSHVVVDEASYPWISRTIKLGETPVTEVELKEYFDLYATSKSHYFSVKSSDGSAANYSIEFYEPQVIPELHNAKAYMLDVPPEKFVAVELKSEPWLETLVQDSHSWLLIEENSALSLRQYSDNAETFNFKVIYEDGSAEYYNIRYVGPALSSLG